jgi:hypothetical protein
MTVLRMINGLWPDSLALYSSETSNAVLFFVVLVRFVPCCSISLDFDSHHPFATFLLADLFDRSSGRDYMICSLLLPPLTAVIGHSAASGTTLVVAASALSLGLIWYKLNAGLPAPHRSCSCSLSRSSLVSFARSLLVLSSRLPPPPGPLDRFGPRFRRRL